MQLYIVLGLVATRLLIIIYVSGFTKTKTYFYQHLSLLICSASFQGLYLIQLYFPISSQVNVNSLQEKLVVAVVGYEINLVNCSVSRG